MREARRSVEESANTEQFAAILERAETDRRLADLLRDVDLASVMLDAEARITFCSDYFLRLTGWQDEDLLGRNYFECFSHGDLQDSQQQFSAMLADGADKWVLEGEIFTRSGARLLVRWSGLILRRADGAAIGIATIGEDVTERERAQTRIAYLNRVYATLSGINTLIVSARNRDALFTAACNIAVDVGGFALALLLVVERGAARVTPVAVECRDPHVLAAVNDILAASGGAVHPMLAQAIVDKTAVIANDSRNDPRVAFRDKHVEFGCGSMVVLPFIVAGEVVALLALYAREPQFFHAEEMALLTELAGDISFAIDHIAKQERVDYLAYYDSLTGLANRNLFLDRLSQYMGVAVIGGHPLALLLIDLERFKNINDTLGRPSGDALLRQAADWLTRYVGDPMHLTRAGGDQFAVILPDVKQQLDAARAVQRMMDAFLQQPFELKDSVFRVGLKVGIALFPDDGTDPDTLFKNAEAALKNAKAGGYRYLFHAPRMTATVAARLTLENQLRRALDREEFVLHYQPKIQIASGRIAGVEALIRWNDPATGLVPPADFIPILEETGLIYDVGRWALHKAIEDYLRWCRLGLAAVPVAVNVSPRQLRRSDFVTAIEAALSVDVRAAAGLELEITEGLIMEDAKQSIASLHGIRALGVGIAIDDFGTGFSSLSYLAKLPLDTLKIDRSFVTQMTGAPEGAALVSMIITLAHSLKLKVVAEGVETREQADLLRPLLCDEMQGYLVSRPLPAAALESAWLTRMPDAIPA